MVLSVAKDENKTKQLRLLFIIPQTFFFFLLSSFEIVFMCNVLMPTAENLTKQQQMTSLCTRILNTDPVPSCNSAFVGENWLCCNLFGLLNLSALDVGNSYHNKERHYSAKLL